jgi:hypothetical protein
MMRAMLPLGRAIVAVVVIAGCASPRPGAIDAGVDASTGIDAYVDPHLDAGPSVDALAPADDAATTRDSGMDAGGCDVGAGHTCARWVSTMPSGERACLGYDGLGVTCSDDPPTTSCDVGSGHTCARWIETQPSGEWACLGYDGLGVTCSGTPGASCDVGSGHTCTRWAQTEPHGEWACLGYDGLGTICR